jgi:hypothetical protein
VDTVYLEGMKISVPPSDVREQLKIGGQDDAGDRPDAGGDNPAADVVVSNFIARDAELTFQGKKAGGRPLSFAIHELTMGNLGVKTEWPFRARLTNPIPRGEIDTTGTVGPWSTVSPGLLPISGGYTLADADMNTINGIGGTLNSTGKYDGILTEIRAVGTASIPDFNLDLGGQPLPLETTFTTTIDGTNGSVRLDDVQAKLLNSPMRVTGAIENRPGPEGHDIRIESEITNGRIEDMLQLAVDAARPLLEGELMSTSTLELPPGEGPVRQRLVITGRFGLENATFNSTTVREKLAELSRRSQGKEDDEAIGRVLSDLSGRYTLKGGVLTLPDLSFAVPGARINLAGTYTVEGGALDFKGTLRMDATVSEAVGGFKSIFIKPFDGLFRERGAGAVIPIKIEGTKDQPKFGVEMGKILK